MSSTMLQLVQQVTSELNLVVPTYVAGNTSQDTVQILALMNRAGYDLTKEYDWRALEKEYRFYTQFVNTTGSSTTNGYVITNVQNFVAQDGTDIDSTYMVTGNSFPQDTYVVSIDKVAKTVTVNQKCSGNQTDASVLFSKTKYTLPPDFETITDEEYLLDCSRYNDLDELKTLFKECKTPLLYLEGASSTGTGGLFKIFKPNSLTIDQITDFAIGVFKFQ